MSERTLTIKVNIPPASVLENEPLRTLRPGLLGRGFLLPPAASRRAARLASRAFLPQRQAPVRWLG